MRLTGQRSLCMHGKGKPAQSMQFKGQEKAVENRTKTLNPKLHVELPEQGNSVRAHQACHAVAEVLN